MKIVVVNGGPRKNCNTDQMLDSFVDGIKSIAPDAEIETIRLYDHKYTGCRSCFACQIKANQDMPGCRVKDDIYELLEDCRKADGIVFGSPVYFYDQTAQLKAFLERLLYPGKSLKPIRSAFIYTMNAPEDIMQELKMDIVLGAAEQFVSRNFASETDIVYAFNTFQYNDKDIYNDGFRSMAEVKKKHRDEQFSKDLKASFDAGVRMADRIKAM